MQFIWVRKYGEWLKIKVKKITHLRTELKDDMQMRII